MKILRRGVITSKGVMPEPDERRVLRALGIPHLRRIEQIEERGVKQAVRLAARRALTMRAFEGSFRVAEVLGADEEGLRIEGASPDFLRSASLARRFAGAKAVAVYAVTLGERWDQTLDALAAQNEPAEAWFLDALGTHLVDQAARLVEEQAGRDFRRVGLRRITRYRPGYGDFPVERQAELCALVEASRIGITPNEAMALLPRKSVTGVVGFREGPEAEEEDAPPSSRREIQAKESA